MRVRVQYTVSGEDGNSVLAFANTVGQPVDKIAKIALIKYINNVLSKAEKMAADKMASDYSLELNDGTGTELHSAGVVETQDSASDSQEL